MAINKRNIIKWVKMLSGKSSLHVEQRLGKYFIADRIEGYFNDMTRKVMFDPSFVNNQVLPTVEDQKGKQILFPVAIIQYAFGCYDLYLDSHEKKYLSEFSLCVEYILKIQEENGAINNFFYIFPDNPYGAMCQGEAASLFARAYIQIKDKRYLEAARKAVEFMLKAIDVGGTAGYSDNDIILYEFTNRKPVLNGWIFALFGIYDYVLLTGDNYYEQILNQCINTLEKNIPRFDNKYWSLYDCDNHIASPFYHKLHIAQLEAMYIISQREKFNNYASRWSRYDKSLLCKTKAFLVKVCQKVIE